MNHQTTNLERMAVTAATNARVAPGEPTDEKSMYFNGYMVGLAECYALVRQEYLEEKKASESVIDAYELKFKLGGGYERQLRDWKLRHTALVSLGERLDRLVEWLKSAEDPAAATPESGNTGSSSSRTVS